jgi:hypothetical protein
MQDSILDEICRDSNVTKEVALEQIKLMKGGQYVW